ncbi:MAG: response regulator transcription factor [Candidatus Andeanibacterium colombiense]|uniref:Response regulator transcription factor n=1 Tax=Candidatus Andeanibacterium colombiense TaxID=3121345 RepID=A0AAJ5X7H7_9SPHN|nr:MAG: response regulator transcription factor [Sphingomonadaceae bacterium]
MTRIVLADDHPFLRTGVEGVLGAMGIDIVASVDNGASALEAIEREDPDVAILDIRMPGMGGVPVLEALRAQGDNRPVILLTAEIEDAALLAAVKSKVDGIVFKHGAETRLHDAIEAVMAGERFIDQALMQRALDLAIVSPQASALSKLSARELQIAEAVAVGKRNRDIAETIGTTEGSIKVYLHRIYEKLSVGSRTELAVLVIREKGN